MATGLKYLLLDFGRVNRIYYGWPVTQQIKLEYIQIIV